VRIRKGRISSRDRVVDVAEGDVIKFQCHGTRIWSLYVVSIVASDLGISLKRN
jgi:hypothetical protein